VNATPGSYLCSWDGGELEERYIRDTMTILTMTLTTLLLMTILKTLNAGDICYNDITYN